jgi:hypothetical protein
LNEHGDLVKERKILEVDNLNTPAQLEPNGSAKTAPHFNYRQRFINWLAGGPPDPQKIAKAQQQRWYRRHHETLYLIGIIFAITPAPSIVSHINGVPSTDELQTVQVRILRTQELEPHLWVQMPDGQERWMEWPVDIKFSRVRSPSYGWTDAQRKALVGCMAEVHGLPLRWTVTDRYRVWSLSCPEKDIYIKQELLAAEYVFILKRGLPVFLVVETICILFMIVVFLREKRGYI